MPSRRDLGRRWFVAVTSGEALGFVLLACVGALIADSSPGVIAAALLIAGAVEGSVLGWFQARVLRSRLRGFAARDWVAATVVGAVVAWTVGLLPSSTVTESVTGRSVYKCRRFRQVRS